MAQTTTLVGSGARAFSATTLGGSTETQVLFVANTDGGALALKQLDGFTSAAITIKVYSVNSDGSTSQLGQFSANGNFSQAFRGGAFANAQENTNLKVSAQGLTNLGLLNAGGIKVTATGSSSNTISIGASLDRRVDGPIN